MSGRPGGGMGPAGGRPRGGPGMGGPMGFGGSLPSTWPMMRLNSSAGIRSSSSLPLVFSGFTCTRPFGRLRLE